MTRAELTSRRLETEGALEAIETYFQKGWTDGLPVVPPTERRVREFLECCGWQPDQVVGTIPQRNRIITAEKVAINATMAGCLPAYAPVVMAAVVCTDQFVPTADATAEVRGMAGYRYSVVPHPTGRLPEDVLLERVRQALPEVVEILTGKG